MLTLREKQHLLREEMCTEEVGEGGASTHRLKFQGVSLTPPAQTQITFFFSSFSFFFFFSSLFVFHFELAEGMRRSYLSYQARGVNIRDPFCLCKFCVRPTEACSG